MSTGSERLALTQVSDLDGVVRLTISGEVDIGTVEILRTAVTAILDDAGLRRLVLDLEALRFLDSSGIAALIGAQRGAVHRNVGFSLVNCFGTARRVLDTAGVYELLAEGDLA